MIDLETGEVLVIAGGVVAPELQYEQFLRLRWALAHAGLLSLSDGFRATLEGSTLRVTFFRHHKPKKVTGAPSRRVPVSGALADDPQPWPGLAVGTQE